MKIPSLLLITALSGSLAQAAPRETAEVETLDLARPVLPTQERDSGSPRDSLAQDAGLKRDTADTRPAAALASFPFSIKQEVWGVLTGERFPDAAQWVLLEQRLAFNELPAGEASPDPFSIILPTTHAA